MFDAIQQEIQVMYPSCQIEKKRIRWTEKNEDFLGGGSYGDVYKGRYKPPGHGWKKAAVKKIKQSPCPSNVAPFLREAAMLK